jgi:type I restriction enzyme S subunit
VSARTVQLGDLIDISKGKKASQVFERPTKNARRYLQIDDLRPDAKPKFVEPFNCPEASKSDVVIAWDGANAGTVSCNLDGYIGSTLAVLRPTNGKIFAPYLARFLEGNFGLLQAQSTGATVPHLDREVLEQLEIPLPDLSEQKRVAGLLEQADRLRRTRRYALELSDTFLPAAFLALFGRIPTQAAPTVEDLAANKPGAIRTGPFGSQLLHSEFTTSGVAVLGIDNAVNNRFEWSERRFVSLEKYQQLKRYTVFPGDVIVTIMGTCGHCAIVPDNIPAAINTKHLCCITLDQQRCIPLYLHGAFLYHPIMRHQLAAATKGAIMEGLNMGIIEGLRIPLPSLSAQQHFAALVERHERLRANQREALRQADHLFQSLLHRAFCSELAPAETVEILKSARVTTQPITISNSKRHLARAALSAEIVHRLHAEPTFGRTKHQKVFHLCEYIAQLPEIQGQYHREAAGPLDNKLIYANAAELKKQKWYEEFSRKQFGHAYRPLSKAGEHRRQLERYWHDKLPAIERLIELMRTWSTEQCEIFSTTYAAWNDLILWNREPTVEAILKEILERWHDNKRRIPERRWCKAINWIRKEGFTPRGFGKPTR